MVPPIVMKKINNLWETHPELAETLYDPEVGYKISVGTNKKVSWKCKNFDTHVWDSLPSKRLKAKTLSCPYCSGKKILVGFNDLATTHPELIDDLVEKSEGYSVTRGSSKKLRWVCSLGHTYETSVFSRAVVGTGCPYCSGNKLLKGFNDLWTTHPKIAQRLRDPEDGYRYQKGSRKKVQWVCKDFDTHIWESSIYSVTVDSVCVFCDNRKLLEGFNDFSTREPELCLELVDKTLGADTLHGSGDIVSWSCGKHTWKTSFYERAFHDRTGCPSCTKRVSGPENDLLDFLRYNDLCVESQYKYSGRFLDLVVHRKGLMFGIEYDGSYWHRGKEMIDTEKSLLALEEVDYLIRVRDSSGIALPTLSDQINHPNYLEVLGDPNEETWNKVLDLILKYA